MRQIRVSDIQLWQANYRQGDVEMIQRSIQRFGYNRSVSLWRDNIVIAGNHTVKALQALEDAQADTPENVRVIDGEWWIDVHDVSHLEDKEAEAYAIADNRTADVATNDAEQLALLLQQIGAYDTDLLEATGWDQDDIHYLMDSIMLPDEDVWSDALASLPDSDRQPFQQMTFTLHDSQVEIVKDALSHAKSQCDFDSYDNENSNGNALTAICEGFINGES